MVIFWGFLLQFLPVYGQLWQLMKGRERDERRGEMTERERDAQSGNGRNAAKYVNFVFTIHSHIRPELGQVYFYGLSSY